MSDIWSKYFTTGEFAKLWGVKKQTLFHYDEIGVFSPAKKESNGYRYYNYPQFEVFGVITTLKEMGMSLSEIKEYLDHRSPDGLVELFEDKISKIDQEIEHLIQIKKMMESKIEVTKMAQELDYNRIELQQLEAKCLFLSKKIDSDDDLMFYQSLMEYVNETGIDQRNWYSIGNMISQQNILNQEYTKYTYFYVPVATKNPNTRLFVRPKGLYVVAYHKGSYAFVYQTYEKMLEFIKKQQLEVIGYAYEELILDEVSVKGYENYLTQIRIHVKYR